jgi:uncharacterized protein
MKILILLPLLLSSSSLLSQTIGTFSSVTPTGQTQQFVIPSTHRFQKLMQSGDALTGGGVLKGAPDFTCYVPIAGSSTNGYISLNHEEAPGGATIMDVNYSNVTKLWAVTNAQAADLTPINGLTIANCSGGLTPWGTVLSGEEYVFTGDTNMDGYNDTGWFVEINPVTRIATRKLWAMGCMAHENAAVSADGSKVYFGADNSTYGFLYKFVCTTPTDLSTGTLYVLQLTSGGNGNWVAIPNTTQADRNNTNTLAQAAGATNISGIEDVEIGPDGKIYIAAKYSQEVYRLTDNGATVSNYETYVSNQCYNFGAICEPYGYAGQAGNDNLAFDGEGNLWVLQDGGRNHIWVVAPTHTAGGTNGVRLFATTPDGSEPTGITFSPDYKFMFLSIQHPSSGNAASQTDAAGNAVVFDRGTTLVIARQEFLGTAPLPIELLSFSGKVLENPQIELTWQMAHQELLEKMWIERSVDGQKFDAIHEKGTPVKAGQAPQYKDHFLDNFGSFSQFYYRLKFLEKDGKTSFSKIVSVQNKAHLPTIKVALNPFLHQSEIHYSNAERGSNILIYNALGEVVWSKSIENTEGSLLIGEGLKTGVYFLKMDNNKQSFETIKFVKME